MRTIYVKPGTKVVMSSYLRQSIKNQTSDEERLKLQEEYYREKHKPLTKAQRMICELEVSELILKAQSQPSELKTLRAENAILKKKLEEIKSIISS